LHIYPFFDYIELLQKNQEKSTLIKQTTF